MEPIKLGKKSLGEPVHPSTKEPSDEYYPSVYISTDKDLGPPDSGTMTVRFRRMSETKTTPKSGDSKFDVCLDLVEITSVKSEGKKGEEEQPAEALDRLRKETEETDEGEY